MASSKDFLEFVMGQISDVPGTSYRLMMGEYVVYADGKVVGGIYDDRFLLKMTPSVMRIMEEEGRDVETDIPYEGAKEMLAADVDDRELICRLAQAAADDLPEPKKRRK